MRVALLCPCHISWPGRPHPMATPTGRSSLPILSHNCSISGGPGEMLTSLACELASSKNITKKPVLPQDDRFAGGLGHFRNPHTDPTSLTTLNLRRREMALRQREQSGTSKRRSHGEERGTHRCWNVFNPHARAPGTAASSNNSPLTVLAESLQTPKMGTFYHAQACTSEGCKSAKTVLCKDPGMMGSHPSIFLVVQVWSPPTNNPPTFEKKT